MFAHSITKISFIFFNWKSHVPSAFLPFCLSLELTVMAACPSNSVNNKFYLSTAACTLFILHLFIRTFSFNYLFFSAQLPFHSGPRRMSSFVHGELTLANLPSDIIHSVLKRVDLADVQNYRKVSRSGIYLMSFHTWQMIGRLTGIFFKKDVSRLGHDGTATWSTISVWVIAHIVPIF